MVIRQMGLLTSLCMFLLSACSLPGLKYQDGGSDVWRGEKGQPGYDADRTAQIQEITPYLTLQMAKQTAEKNQALQASSSYAQGIPPIWNYRIGVGDVLSVIVWDHPEMTNPTGSTQNVDGAGRVVRPDGTIFYPYAGSVPADGKTTEEISKLLTVALARVIQSPQVDVTVLQYRSQFVNIVGDVNQPCRVPVTNIPLTVIDALKACETIRASTGNREIELSRAGTRRTFDLYSIYKGHDSLLSEPLLGGDMIYVKDDRASRVFVVGEVSKQASISIPVSGLTLADAINNADIGGLKQDSTDARNVYVFRGGVGASDSKNGQLNTEGFRPDIYHINLASADALLLADQFVLQPRDIVFAATAPVVSYGRVISLMLTPYSALLQTGIFVQNTGR